MNDRMTLSNEGRFRKAVRYALAASIAGTGMFGAQAVAQQPGTPPGLEKQEDEATQLDVLEVTGSRLKRAGVEGALPVTVIDREQIDLSGDVSVAEFLRKISLNTFGSFRQQSGSSAQSVATIDLRGLGPERTLVLIDGKRAPKAPTFASAQDLNAIPLAAVERVEILQDGASAIYGSDAIAGVVNIIMRKDFNGTEFMYGFGRPSVTGGDTEQGSFVAGIPSANGNVIIGASYNRRGIIFAKDQVEQGISTPGASIYGNNYVTPADEFRTTSAVPGGCEASDAFFLAPAPLGDIDNDGDLEPTSVTDYDGDGDFDLCRFDFNQVAADEASAQNMALFAKSRFQISQDWSVYATGSVSRAESFGRYAPAPAVLFVPGGTAAEPSGPSGIDHDGDGIDDDVYVFHRFAALGNRDDTVHGNVYDLLAGFEGTLGPASLDFGARYNEYKAITLGRNYVVNPIASQYATEGIYNFRDPLANDPATLSAMKATIARESTWRSEEAWATASFNNVMALPGGAMGVAFGWDYHNDDYFDQYDSLSEAGVIGGSAGNSAGTGRYVRGYFAEVLLPIVQNLEVTVAARQDEYSDVGGQFSPKVSLRFQALDNLLFRAAYGEGFRAPTLDIISQKPSFSAEPVLNDQATCVTAGETFTDGACSAAVQVDTTIVANPNLAPESSEQLSLGLVYDPTDWVNVAFDYYSYEITETIAFVSPTDLVDLENQGIPLPPGFSLTRSPVTGALTDIVAGYGNRGTLKTNGLNLDLGINSDLGPGRLETDLQLSYVLGYELSTIGRDQAGEPGFPELRGRLLNAFNFWQLETAWNVNYIGDQARTVDGNGRKHGSTGSYVTHDFQLTYHLPINAGSITAGVQNAFEEEVPLYPYDGRPYNFYLYEAYGRIPYFRYSLRFQ